MPLEFDTDPTVFGYNFNYGTCVEGRTQIQNLGVSHGRSATSDRQHYLAAGEVIEATLMWAITRDVLASV